MDRASSSSRVLAAALLGGAVVIALSTHCGGSTTSDPGVDGGSGSSGSSTAGSVDVATTAATGPSAGAGGASDVTTTGAGGTVGAGTGGAGTGGAGGTSGTNLTACTTNASCMLRPGTCCGQCGAVTRTDFVAINRASASAYDPMGCGSGPVACPACFMAQDPNLVATCSAGRCEMVDLHAESLTACNTGADCRIRTNECCECNGKFDREHLVAVSIAASAALHDVICDPDSACAKCLPAYPPEATPACDQGHCIVKYTN